MAAEPKTDLPDYRDLTRLYYESATEAARIMLDEPEAGDQYQNPRSAGLFKTRAELAELTESLSPTELGSLRPILVAMADVYALSASSSLSMTDYVHQELGGHNKNKPLAQPSRKEKAGYSIAGIGQLQNAFQRVRVSPVSGQANELTREDFEYRYKDAAVWSDPETKRAFYEAVERSFTIIKFLCRREALIHAGGDADSRAEIDQQDLQAANKWLELLKDEFRAGAKIKPKHLARAAIVGAQKLSKPPR